MCYRNLGHLVNVKECGRRYFVTTSQISLSHLEGDLEYLSRNHLGIHGLVFNYNYRYIIHDIYSK